MPYLELTAWLKAAQVICSNVYDERSLGNIRKSGTQRNTVVVVICWVQGESEDFTEDGHFIAGDIGAVDEDGWCSVYVAEIWLDRSL
ncbi:unnamed protein product [Cylicocyclus nassatus]|uniref:Uncharacterized protein n=1 Tax=Cylicocyclus nassatus TaxID=53992 RepID=A0AA36HH21_CYLNA|nr:unnamed protein product [Cylicocyclus nassatus]